MSRHAILLAAISLSCVFGGAGCNDFDPKMKPQSTVLHKWTQDIGEFKAEEKRTVSEGKPEYNDPILGPLEMYGPIVQDISSMAVDQQLAFFHIQHERYPTSHKEFMDEIILKNNLKLPVLPGKKQYQYDVANHRIVVVEPLKPGAPNASAAATGAAPATTPAAPPAGDPNAAPVAAPAAPAPTDNDPRDDPNRIQLPGGLSLPKPAGLPE